MNNEVLAIILGGGQGSRLFPLTQHRSKPAVPIGGSYRLIDIPISNCLHADIRRIFVLTQFNSASLNRHISQTYRMDPFSRGSVEILADQPACSAKYDEVQMARGVLRPDGSAWAAGDCAKDDLAEGVLTQGFAEAGVVYVNGQTTLVTATTHEILHNNVGAGFRTKTGETFNEGTTELLARRSLSVAGVTVPSITACPDQVKFTVRLQKLVGEKTLTDSYFGGPDPLIAKFEELKGVGTWATLKAHAEALDEAPFNAVLAAKKV